MVHSFLHSLPRSSTLCTGRLIFIFSFFFFLRRQEEEEEENVPFIQTPLLGLPYFIYIYIHEERRRRRRRGRLIHDSGQSNPVYTKR